MEEPKKPIDQCPKCRSLTLVVVEGEWGPHKRRKECGFCGRFITWMPNVQSGQKRPREEPKENKRRKIGTDQLERMCDKSLGRANFIILFDPFSQRPDYVVEDVCAFLESKGCKITDRDPHYNHWVTDKIIFEKDGKSFSWYLHALCDPGLPIARPLVCGILTCGVMNMNHLKKALELTKREKEVDEETHILNLDVI